MNKFAGVFGLRSSRREIASRGRKSGLIDRAKELLPSSDVCEVVTELRPVAAVVDGSFADRMRGAGVLSSMKPADQSGAAEVGEGESHCRHRTSLDNVKTADRVAFSEAAIDGRENGSPDKPVATDLDTTPSPPVGGGGVKRKAERGKGKGERGKGKAESGEELGVRSGGWCGRGGGGVTVVAATDAI